MRLIFSEAFLPGDRLVERDLAAKLDLSRIPVREGLQKLVSKGILLKDEVNRGLRLRENFTGFLLDTQSATQSLHGQRGDLLDLCDRRGGEQHRRLVVNDDDVLHPDLLYGCDCYRRNHCWRLKHDDDALG